MKTFTFEDGQIFPRDSGACFIKGAERSLTGDYHQERVPTFHYGLEQGLYQMTIHAYPHTTIKYGNGQLLLKGQPTASNMINHVYVADSEITLAWWGEGIKELSIQKIEREPKLILIGDSTMSEHPPEKFPQYGWGQLLAEQLRSMASFNVAQSGRSSKSFREEGHFERALSHLNKGDWVLIQFGHNDQKEDHRGTTPEQYKENLRKYIREIREVEAIPFLLSPVQRRYFSKLGRMLNPHEGYQEKVEEVAKEESAFYMDLTKLSSDAYQEQGPEASKAWFMWLKQGEEPNYPEGVKDNTHFSEQGARAIASMVVNEWQRILKIQ